MSVKICQDGKELAVCEILAYLNRAYSIPDSHIRGVSLVGDVGEPIMITVTVFMQTEPTVAGHEGSDRWTGGDRKDEP